METPALHRTQGPFSCCFLLPFNHNYLKNRHSSIYDHQRGPEFPLPNSSAVFKHPALRPFLPRIEKPGPSVVKRIRRSLSKSPLTSDEKSRNWKRVTPNSRRPGERSSQFCAFQTGGTTTPTMPCGQGHRWGILGKEVQPWAAVTPFSSRELLASRRQRKGSGEVPRVAELGGHAPPKFGGDQKTKKNTPNFFAKQAGDEIPDPHSPPPSLASSPKFLSSSWKLG